jgi:hypothetical protein
MHTTGFQLLKKGFVLFVHTTIVDAKMPGPITPNNNPQHNTDDDADMNPFYKQPQGITQNNNNTNAMPLRGYHVSFLPSKRIFLV